MPLPKDITASKKEIESLAQALEIEEDLKKKENACKYYIISGIDNELIEKINQAIEEEEEEEEEEEKIKKGDYIVLVEIESKQKLPVRIAKDNFLISPLNHPKYYELHIFDRNKNSKLKLKVSKENKTTITIKISDLKLKEEVNYFDKEYYKIQKDEKSEEQSLSEQHLFPTSIYIVDKSQQKESISNNITGCTEDNIIQYEFNRRYENRNNLSLLEYALQDCKKNASLPYKIKNHTISTKYNELKHDSSYQNIKNYVNNPNSEYTKNDGENIMINVANFIFIFSSKKLEKSASFDATKTAENNLIEKTLKKSASPDAQKKIIQEPGKIFNYLITKIAAKNGGLSTKVQELRKDLDQILNTNEALRVKFKIEEDNWKDTNKRNNIIDALKEIACETSVRFKELKEEVYQPYIINNEYDKTVQSFSRLCNTDGNIGKKDKKETSFLNHLKLEITAEDKKFIEMIDDYINGEIDKSTTPPAPPPAPTPAPAPSPAAAAAAAPAPAAASPALVRTRSLPSSLVPPAAPAQDSAKYDCIFAYFHRTLLPDQSQSACHAEDTVLDAAQSQHTADKAISISSAPHATPAPPAAPDQDSAELDAAQSEPESLALLLSSPPDARLINLDSTGTDNNLSEQNITTTTTTNIMPLNASDLVLVATTNRDHPTSSALTTPRSITTPRVDTRKPDDSSQESRSITISSEANARPGLLETASTMSPQPKRKAQGSVTADVCTLFDQDSTDIRQPISLLMIGGDDNFTDQAAGARMGVLTKGADAVRAARGAEARGAAARGAAARGAAGRGL